MTPLKIPVAIHPGKKEKSEITWSYHLPLSSYLRLLKDNGFVVELIDEWLSDKKSQGSKAFIEDRARLEFPLFMALLCKKER